MRVPASSANLGPGFDSLGIALGIYDEVVAEADANPGVRVQVSGEAADQVALDENHLVAKAIHAGLAFAGVSTVGLNLRCSNTIPHSRGLGSSAAAVVSGLAAASGLLAAAGGQPLTAGQLVQLAGQFEGHPDNAAASILGGPVVTWSESPDEQGSGSDVHPRYFARKLTVHPDIAATVFVPATESSTSFTRGLLPEAVPRADAVFNVSRAALAVYALTTDPGCLFAATDDRLHQGYRAPAMPETAQLVQLLRTHGHAATVSGAGPTVLVLGAGDGPDAQLRAAAADLGFQTHAVDIAAGAQTD